MKRGAGWRILLGAAPALLILLLFLFPLLEVVRLGLVASDPRAVLGELWTNPYHRNRLVFTFQQAVLSTALTLAAGLPLAWVFAHYEFPGRRALRALFTAPFVLPALVVAVALHSFVGASSVLGVDLLGAAGPLGAILVAHVYYNLSLVIRIVGGLLERIPPELSHAARTLGATRAAAVLRVQLPLALPAVIACAALVFLFSLTSFGVIVLLGGEHVGTIETLIWDNVKSIVAHYDRAAALGVLQLATTLTALLLYVHFQRRAQARFRPPPAYERPRLPSWGWSVLVPTALFLMGPSFALAVAAFTYDGSWSIEGVRLLTTREAPLGSYSVGRAILNSLQFGILATAIAVPLALLSLLAFRGSARRLRLGEAFLLAPLGASPVLLGLGMLVAFDGEPLWDLRAHPLRIVAVHTLVAFPFVTRILAPTFDAIESNLRDAARTLGASPIQTFLRIELPLLGPALRVGAIFAFATSLGEFGGTLLLRRPEWLTLPLAIFDAFARPGASYRAQAEVLTFLLLVVATPSSSRGSTPTSTADRSFATSTSTCRPARSTSSSGPADAARPRSSRPSPVSIPPGRGACSSTATRSPGSLPSGAASSSSTRRTPSSPTSTSHATSRSRPACGVRPTRPAGSPTSCGSWDSKGSALGASTTSPAGRSSASPSPGPSPPTPACSFSTSRTRPSTAPCGSSCGPTSAGSCATGARPPSTSPTTTRRPSRWRTPSLS
ncbi:MAG: ABC transporter permease subunit [Euryarchaeota archaeon]|nr:ABC transporter permease subunit [Euryarchaeota archaeon]